MKTSRKALTGVLGLGVAMAIGFVGARLFRPDAAGAGSPPGTPRGAAAAGAADQADGRQAVRLSAAERDVILTEMRMLLAAVGTVSERVAAKDYPAAAETARLAGLDVALRIGGEHPAILAKLPVPMKKLGFDVHRDFDRLAARLRQGPVSEHEVLTTLGATIRKCTACHSAYKIATDAP